jgi:hypothetical protein
MKKKQVALLAAAMMTLAAGNAFADFANTDLIRVVYNAVTNTETATDLGAISSLLSVTNDNIATNPFTNAISSGSFANSVVAYYAENSTANQFYISTNGTITATSVNTGKTITSATVISSANGLYTSLSGGTGYAVTPLVTNGTNVANTFFLVADAEQTVGAGSFDALLANGSSNEASLAGLASNAVQQSLYLVSSGGGHTANTVTNENLVIQTNANGTTTINPGVAATPIPPAFFLMGSGLLGMLGLGRKKSA